MRTGLRFLVAVTASLVALAVITAEGTDSVLSEIQLQLGDLLVAEERFVEAIEAYTQAKSGATPRQLFRARQGTVLSMLRLARFDEAHVEADLAHQATPDDPATMALYGDALWSAGLFDEAERVFRDALALDDGLSRGHHGLAKALAARSQLTAAMEVAQEALRLSPRDGEIHHTVGGIYERMYRFEEAAIAFGNYVNLLPAKNASERAAWSRAEIRFLRSFARRTPFGMAADAAKGLYTIPFELEREKIIVKARVNRGRLLDFVVDTGAEQTVLSREVASRAGVQPIVFTLSAGVGEVGLRSLQLARIDSFEIGNLKLTDVPTLIKNPPLGGLPRRETESFSPVAAGLSMKIDYDRRRLTLGRRLPVEPADVELPLRVHRLATVRGRINDDRDARFVVDTGGEVISISTAAASSLSHRPMVRHLPLKVYGSSGWDPEAFLLPGIDLEFDTIQFPNYPVVVLNLRAPSALLGFQVGGIIGHNFLSRYNVVLDLQESVVRLTARATRQRLLD